MVNLNGLGTETRNAKTKDLDLMSVKEIIELMNEEDLNVLSAIKEAIPQIEALINQTIQA